MNKREQDIKQYGLKIVLANEKYWEQLGYKINYEKDRLEKINASKTATQNDTM